MKKRRPNLFAIVPLLQSFSCPFSKNPYLFLPPLDGLVLKRGIPLHIAKKVSCYP